MRRFLKGSVLASTVLATGLAIGSPASAQTAIGDQSTDSGAAPAEAQPADEMQGDVIIVTAQRRAESAQDVPISLTALSGETLARTGVQDIKDLQRVVPSLSIQQSQQVVNTRVAIRGIGSSGNSAIEPSVAAFVDGVYIARPGSLLAGLNDIDRVEVLRGPQGTLFGRNASVGAISFQTALPTSTFEAEVGAEYGSFDRMRLDGFVSGPVSDRVSIRIAGLVDDTDGYGSNLLTGQSLGSNTVKSIRGTILADLTDRLTWTVRGDYQAIDGDGAAVISVLADTVTPQARANFLARTGNRIPILDDSYTTDVNQLAGGNVDDRQYGFSSTLDYELGAISIKLISAYRDWSNSQLEDELISTPLELFGRDVTFSSKTHSQELQIGTVDNLLDGLLGFTVGLYYFDEDYSIDEVTSLGADYCDTIVAVAAPALLNTCRAGPFENAGTYQFDQDTKSYAAFGQTYFDLTDALTITAGLRYSYDDKSADLVSVRNNPTHFARVNDTAADLEFSGGELTYRLAATYDLAADVMLFASHATGYKSGGFDAGNGGVLGQDRVFAPETTKNFEFGIKSQLFDRRATANVTLFRTDIDDFQLRSYDGVAFSVRNAGSIRQQGVEFEFAAEPAPGLDLGLTGTYLDSEFTDFATAPGLPGFGGVQDLTGERAPTSPRWQGIATAAYTGSLSRSADLGFTLSSHLSFQSNSDVGSAADNNPQGIQPGYALLGARLSLFKESRDWEFYVAGDNLTDKGYCTLIFPQPFAGPLGLVDSTGGGAVQRCVVGTPRSFRVGARVTFQ